MAKRTTTNDYTTGLLAWLLSLFFGFLAPLIIYFVEEKKTGPNVENIKNALNFQISMTIYFIVSFILIFVLIGIPLIFVLGILCLIFTIIGAVKASQGEVYKAPLTISFVR